MTSPHLTIDQKQAIPDEVLQAAEKADAECQRENCQRMDCNGFLCVRALEAVFAERQKHDLPTSPDLQAEAERVFADVQRAVLVEDVKALLAWALWAAEQRGRDAERDRAVAEQIAQTERRFEKVR